MRTGWGFLPTRNMIRSEWTKLRSVRTTWIVAFSTIASGVTLSVLGISDLLGGSLSDVPAGWDPTAGSLKGFLFAQLLIGMLGAFSITPEYSSGMIGTSIAMAPKRSRFLAAKTFVVAAVALVISLLTTFISFGVVQLMLHGAGLPAAGLGDPGVLGALGAATLYLTTVALVGVAIGVLTRSSTGSLAVLVGALLLVPALLPGIPGAIGEAFGRFWPFTAGQAAYTVVPVDGAVAPGLGILILLVATAAVSTASHWVIRTQDV
ncbi:ABC transporter permease [Actinosynnema sp. CS-041913]|uniref:ABC transporter permease n=1 Tax=Actinosynnema sp. CS-041913 TaxID=3239917 RepID=UPI003D8BEBC2